MLANNEEGIQEQEPVPKPKQELNYETLIDEFNTFIDLFKTTCLIYYSKIEYISKQLLDKTNKDLLVFLWENQLQDYHIDILNDIFETDINFIHNHRIKFTPIKVTQ